MTELASMIDVSAVQANSSWENVQSVARVAQDYRCISVFSLPSFTKELIELMRNCPEVKVGGVVGFPGGGETTSIKAKQAEELVAFGCMEIDMVMNVGKMLSDRQIEVEKDIQAVKTAIGAIPLKVILECHYLNDNQIRDASERCVRAGADWVKTGTGWAPTATTLEQIRLIKETVGDRAKVKAAGGIRNLSTLLKMNQFGAERFGIGYLKAQMILDEFKVLSENMSTS